MTSDRNTGPRVGQGDFEPENGRADAAIDDALRTRHQGTGRAGAAAEPEADPDAELERLGVDPEAFHAANPGWRLMPADMQAEMAGVIERHRQRAAGAEADPAVAREAEMEAGQ
jgi:hypothetical protein